jgi:hypothetical protein
MNKLVVAVRLLKLRIAWPFFIWEDDPYKSLTVRKRADLKSKFRQNLASDLNLFVKTDRSIASESRINSRWGRRYSNGKPESEG